MGTAARLAGCLLYVSHNKSSTSADDSCYGITTLSCLEIPHFLFAGQPIKEFIYSFLWLFRANFSFPVSGNLERNIIESVYLFFLHGRNIARCGELAAGCLVR